MKYSVAPQPWSAALYPEGRGSHLLNACLHSSAHTGPQSPDQRLCYLPLCLANALHSQHSPHAPNRTALLLPWLSNSNSAFPEAHHLHEMFIRSDLSLPWTPNLYFTTLAKWSYFLTGPILVHMRYEFWLKTMVYCCCGFPPWSLALGLECLEESRNGNFNENNRGFQGPLLDLEP